MRERNGTKHWDTTLEVVRTAANVIVVILQVIILIHLI